MTKLVPSCSVLHSDSSFLSLVHDQLVAVGIAKLRHPANRRFRFLHVERDAALF